MSASVISLRSVVALIGRYPVLAGADFELDRGEIVALSGPNGAGKTSLLRVISGLVAIHRGEATVLGHDLRRDRRSVRRQIGFMGHDPFLYDELTVRENVEFFVAMGGGEVTVDKALDIAGLSGRLETVMAVHLSAGQRRRVALAVLVARSPALWLLDEPHAGLDRSTRAMLDGVLADAAAAGAGIVFSSHEPAAVEALAHRGVTVDGGVVTKTREVTGVA